MKVQPGTTTSSTVNVSDSVASAFLTASSQEQFTERLDILFNWFNQETKWMVPNVVGLPMRLETCCNVCTNCDACQECEEQVYCKCCAVRH